MALTTGEISFSTLQDSLGPGPALFTARSPVLISEYYRAGAYVKDAIVNEGVPTTSVISLKNFYGAVDLVAYSLTIASTTTNYNVRAAAVAAGWNQNTPVQVKVTVNSGIVVGSTAWNSYAFETAGSWPAGSELVLVNNGYIVGKGGDGSTYHVDGGGPRDNPAYNGGYCMHVALHTKITNNGIIAKGGGGWSSFSKCTSSWAFGSNSWFVMNGAGGGGAGYPAGVGGGTGYDGVTAGNGTLLLGGASGGGVSGPGNKLGVAGYTETEYWGVSPTVTGGKNVRWVLKGDVRGPINA